jgi:hypothetical protein
MKNAATILSYSDCHTLSSVLFHNFYTWIIWYANRFAVGKYISLKQSEHSEIDLRKFSFKN